MRLKRFLWILGVAALAAGYTAAAGVVKARMERSLSDLFGREASIRVLYFTPWGLHLSGVVIPPGPGQESTVSVEQASLRVGFISLATGRPRFQVGLVQPRISFERDPMRVRHLPVSWDRLKRTPGIPLARLRVREGEVLLIDRAVLPAVFCGVRDLSLSLRADRINGGFTYSAIGLLEGRSRQLLGEVQASGRYHPAGWFQTRLAARHEGLEQAAPYLKRILGSAPSQGRFMMTSTVTCLADGVLAENEMTASEVSFATDEPTVMGMDGNQLVDLLRDPKGEIHLSFFVRGHVGQPLNWSNLLEATLRESLRQAMARNIHRSLTEAEPPRSVEELLRRGKDSLGR